MAQGHEPLFEITPDGAELQIKNGDVLLSNGLATAATISLFGGNAEDDGSFSTENDQWWGNFVDNDPLFSVRSRTLALTRGIALTTGALERIRKAIEADLQWMLDESIADSIAVELAIVAPRRLQITGTINVSGVRYPFGTTVEFTNGLTGQTPIVPALSNFIELDDFGFVELDNFFLVLR